MKNIKIDWPNHIIGFFSALFGILIAFQLDEWREGNSQARLAEEALKLVRNETSLNKNILGENINRNEISLSTLHSLLPFIDEHMNFKGSYEIADSINRSNASVRIFTGNESGKLLKKNSVFELHIAMDKIEAPEIHSSAWESAKATGALNYMSLEKVDLLSLIYNNSKLRDDLNDLRQTLKISDRVKTKSEFVNILNELEKTNSLIKRELINFESYVSMLENTE